MRDQQVVGGTKTDGLSKYYFNLRNDSWHASFPTTGILFEKFEQGHAGQGQLSNEPSYTTKPPEETTTSLSVLGASMSWIAFTLARSILILFLLERSQTIYMKWLRKHI